MKQNRNQPIFTYLLLAFLLIAFKLSLSVVLADESSKTIEPWQTIELWGLKINLSESEQEARVEIDTSIHEKTILLLNKPERLVIDLPPNSIKQQGTNQKALKKGIFSNLRVGISPDKVRLVFDLSATAPTKFKRIEDSKIIVVLEKSAKVSAIPTSTNLPKPSYTPTFTPIAVKPTPTIPKLSISTPTAIPAETHEIKLRNNSTDKHHQLTAINFLPILRDENPTVSFVLDEVSDFELLEQNDVTVDLVLYNTSLSDEAFLLPNFPPDTFAGLKAIQARTEDDNTIITLHCDDNTKPRAVAGDHQVLVKFELEP
jgi:hypothetical protein